MRGSCVRVAPQSQTIEIMDNLELERVDLMVSGKICPDGKCFIWSDGHAYLNREEMQQVIDHLTELLKQ